MSLFHPPRSVWAVALGLAGLLPAQASAGTAQSIAFPSFAAKTVGDSDFTIGAAASSGLPVKYLSTNPRIATVDSLSGLVHILAAGEVTISATQAGDATYDSAAFVQRTLRVRVPSGVVAWGYNLYGQTDVPADLRGVLAVAGGGSFTLALKSDSTVTAWGRNDYHQLDIPAGLSHVVSVAAGSGFALALKADGTVTAWGDNYYGQCDVPTSLSDVVSITAGSDFALALKSNGTVVAWGNNGFGQTTLPANLTSVVAIAGGSMHAAALLRGGKLVAWGDNSSKQTDVPGGVGYYSLGSGTFHTLATSMSYKPSAWGDTSDKKLVIPSDLYYPIMVAGGVSHSLALGNSGFAYAWGRNSDNQATVPAGLPVVQGIAAGFQHSLALVASPVITRLSRSEGLISGGDTITIYGSRLSRVTSVKFGSAEGILRSSYIGENSLSVIVPAGVLGVVDVSVSAPFAGASLVSAGSRYRYKKSQTVELQTIPVKKPGDADFGVVASSTYGLPLRISSTRPDVATIDSLTGAVHVVGLGETTLRAVQAGNDSLFPAHRIRVLRVRSMGRVVAWGDTAGNVNIAPSGLDSVVAIASGHSRSAALKSDGTVVQWGVAVGASAASLGLPVVAVPDLHDILDISEGWSHSMALRKDGTVVAWGGNSNGEATVPAGLSDVVAIAAGEHHCLALKSDGQVVAWGFKGNGQGSVPPIIEDAVSIYTHNNWNGVMHRAHEFIWWGQAFSEGGISAEIAAAPWFALAQGLSHTLGMLPDGTVRAWGQSGDYTTVPADLDSVVAISAGGYYSLALRKNGTVRDWGSGILSINRAGTTMPTGLSGVLAIAAGVYHSAALVRAPQVTGLSPATGSVAGGTVVTITGKDLQKVNEVRFGAVPGTSLVVAPDGNSLTVTAPAGAAGTVDVTVSTPLAGTSVLSPNDRFTYVQPTVGIASVVRNPVSTRLDLSVPSAFARPSLAVGAPSVGLSVPGCDQDKSCQALEIALPQPASIELGIFDNLGVRVIGWNGNLTQSDLVGLPPLQDGRHLARLGWNLRSESGRAVPEGVYLWKVIVTLADGSRLEKILHLGVKR